MSPIGLNLLVGQRWRGGQVSALCLKAVLVRLVVHRILLAVVARVGVGATHSEGSMGPATFEFARLIAVNAIARIEAKRRDDETTRV